MKLVGMKLMAGHRHFVLLLICRRHGTKLLAVRIALLFALATMCSCGALDPTKYDSYPSARPQSKSRDTHSAEISIADWETVLERTADELNIDIDQSGHSTKSTAFRSVGKVIESGSESVYVGLAVNILDCATVPGVRRTANVYVFSFLKAKKGWVIVFFDNAGNRLAVSDVLLSESLGANHFDLAWSVDKEGYGGEGGNYGKTHTVYRASLHSGGELRLERNEHYEMRVMFGLSWGKGDHKSVTIFPRIEKRQP